MLKKSAFTLSEVLITLAIIGIIASMTIPALIQSVENAGLQESLKKSFGELVQITNLLKKENSGNLIGVFTSSNDMRNDFGTHLNFIKSCDNGVASGECWHIHNGAGHWKSYSGANISNAWSINSGHVLANGAFVNYVFYDSNCAAVIPTHINNTGCGFLILDVNGFKNPNKLGYDIFYLYLTENGIYPLGDQNSAEHNCTGDGVFCAAVKLIEG